MKLCCTCRIKKDITEFTKNRSTKDGLQHQCKDCKVISSRKWREKNPEKIRELTQAWLKTNGNAEKKAQKEKEWAKKFPEKKVASSIKWQSKNQEKLKIYRDFWQANNKEKIKKRRKIWVSRNVELVRLLNQNYRAKKRNAGGLLSKGLAQILFKKQKGLCSCCGKPLGDKYHLDHIMPIALGGSNTDDNIQLLRQRCNNQKSAKHPIDFMQERGFLL